MKSARIVPGKQLRVVEIIINDLGYGTETKVRTEGCWVRCPGCGKEVMETDHRCVRTAPGGEEVQFAH